MAKKQKGPKLISISIDTKKLKQINKMLDEQEAAGRLVMDMAGLEVPDEGKSTHRKTKIV